MSKNFASREVCNLIIADYKTGKPVLRADYCNTTTTEMEDSPVYAVGGWQAPRRVAFNGSRNATFRLETQVRSFEIYSLLTGAAVESTAKFIKREVLTASAGVITLSKTPVVGSVNVFKAEDDCGTTETVTVSGKTVTLSDSSASGSYVVYYLVELTEKTQKLSIKSDTMPKDVTIYGETLMKTEDGELLPYKMIVHRAAPSAALTLDFSNDGDPATLSAEFAVLATKDNDMIDLIMITDEDEDSAVVDPSTEP